MSPRTRTQDGLVSLEDRLAWTSALRLVVHLAPPLLWWLLPSARETGWPSVGVPAALAVVSAVVAWLPVVTSRAPVPDRLSRGVALSLLGAGLVVDVVVLTWAFRCLGGLDGPVPWLLLVHCAGTTLLTSFRTGVRATFAASVALLVVAQADASGLLGPSVLQLRTAPFLEYLGGLWALVLGIACSAAANERELRRRRYDSDVLHRFALDLDKSPSGSAAAGLLAHVCREDLLARRAVVLLAGADGGPWTVVDDAGRSSSLAAPVVGSLVAQAVRTGGPVLAARLDPVADAALLEVLPGLGHVVVVPFPGGAGDGPSGVVVVERLGARRTPRRGLPRSVERRLVATLVHAVAACAQTLTRHVLLDRLQLAATTDGLTGLPNRAAVEEAVRAAAQGPVSVVLLDLDHFKQVNDTLGHAAGDAVLRAVGEVLRAVVPETATPGRWGGEEFCVVLPGVGARGARGLAERVCAAVRERAVDLGGTVLRVTASVGVASSAPGRTSTEALLGAADGALYAAKAGGRDRVAEAPPAGHVAVAAVG